HAVLAVPQPLHAFPTRRSSDLPRSQAKARPDGRRLARRPCCFGPPTCLGRRGLGALLTFWESDDGEARNDQDPAQLDCRYRLLLDRKSTRLNSSHVIISYAVFC